MRELAQSDQILLKKARSGDHNAFQKIVERYEKPVITTVLGMLGDVAEVDDVAQNVFIRFYKALHNFRGDAQLNTYLTRIAINLSLNELKKRKRKSNWFSFFKKNEKQILEIPDTTQNINDFDNKDLVNQALQQLPEDLRSIVVLRLMDGYSTEETAEILKIPYGTVLSRLSRGRKKLKEILLEYK